MLLGKHVVVSVACRTWISRVDGITATDTKEAGVDELVGAGTKVSSDCWAGCSAGCCVDVIGGTIGSPTPALLAFDPGAVPPLPLLGIPHPLSPAIGVQTGSSLGTQSVMGGEVVSSLWVL